MEARRRPHVVLLPFPAQGHVRAFMQLAHQLCHVHGFHATFVTTSYIHKRLGHHEKKAGTDDGLHFLDMQDGFPEDYYTLRKLNVLYHACTTIGPKLETLIGELAIAPTCIISDLGLLQEANKVAAKFGVASAAFSPLNAFTMSAKFYCPRLVAEGLLPLPTIVDDNPTSSSSTKHVAAVKDTDVRTLHTARADEEVALLAREVTCVPGMYPIRLREYYIPLLVRSLSDPTYQSLSIMQMEYLRKCDWVLMNTFYELEAAVIEPFQQDSGIKLTSIGPLVAAAATTVPTSAPEGISTHNYENVKTVNNTDTPSELSSMWPEETTKCIEWLDNQSPSSVIYVSFGSLMLITTEKLHEFMLGLEDSGVPFLLVLRPNVVDGGHDQTGVISAPGTGSAGGQLLHEIVLPVGFEERTKARSLIVSWAPQLRVLGHPATAGFVSHCGWNSVLESISVGMPMLAYPFFADQPSNSRYCVSVWKMALELETTASDEGRNHLDRHEIAAKVKALVTPEVGGVRGAAIAWREAARKAIAVGGSSYLDMAAFVTDMYRRAQEASSPSLEESSPR